MAVWSEVPFSVLSPGLRLDPEFYQPKFLAREKKLQHIHYKKLGEIAYVTDGEHGSVEYKDDGVKYLTAENIKNGYVDDSQIKYVDHSVHVRNARAAVKVGDVLISIKGTLGLVALAENWLPEANMNRDVAIIKLKSNEVPSEYLAAFLMSDFGQFQCLREGSGGVQQMITLSRLREILIPIINEIIQRRVMELWKEAKRNRDESFALYDQAQERLLQELGMKDLDLSPMLCFEQTFLETQYANRLDAEFYQPAYYRLLEAIERTNQNIKLGEILECCGRGLQPKYDREGDVLVVNTKHMSRQFLFGNYERTNKVSWERQKKARLNQFDVLFYSTGAYIGRTNCWLENTTAIASNHVTIMRPNKLCNPIYLSLFLNSPAGLLQTDRHAHGSAQREIYPDDIRDFTLWLPPEPKQENLAQLILNAKYARDNSLRLLEEAKQLVEKAILGVDS